MYTAGSREYSVFKLVWWPSLCRSWTTALCKKRRMWSKKRISAGTSGCHRDKRHRWCSDIYSKRREVSDGIRIMRDFEYLRVDEMMKHKPKQKRRLLRWWLVLFWCGWRDQLWCLSCEHWGRIEKRWGKSSFFRRKMFLTFFEAKKTIWKKSNQINRYSFEYQKYDV